MISRVCVVALLISTCVVAVTAQTVDGSLDDNINNGIHVYMFDPPGFAEVGRTGSIEADRVGAANRFQTGAFVWWDHPAAHPVLQLYCRQFPADDATPDDDLGPAWHLLAVSWASDSRSISMSVGLSYELDSTLKCALALMTDLNGIVNYRMSIAGTNVEYVTFGDEIPSDLRTTIQESIDRMPTW